ncbi:CHAT domain-containing protein [Actinacidiphila glaucinigra]|uniref:CHAT domain-containing protein n=1 Tax=Actinacidiphila glaucinigra TaxID=235986 RepID=UPI0035DE8004
MRRPPRDLPPTPPAGALELARLLSFATRIEPELIRAVRLRFLPRLDVGAEADLWFCDWVVARTPEAIALVPECLPYLRAGLTEKLQTEPGLDDVFEVVEKFHRGMSPALVLEEQVTWHSLTGNTDMATRQLNRALHALVQQNRSGLAGWFAEAWQRLPAEARSTTTAWSLANASRPHVPSLETAASPQLALTDIASIAAAVGETRLGVLREGSALILGHVRGEHAAAVLVPDTHPRMVEVVTDSSARPVQVDEGEVVRVEVGRGLVGLRTGTGQVYEIEPPTPPALRPAPSAVDALTDLLGPHVRADLVPQLTGALWELLDRFRHGDNREPLREALDLGSRLLAIGYTPRKFPELGYAMAEAHHLNGISFGNRRSLEQAIGISEELIDVPDREIELRARIVYGTALRALFSHTGILAQLHEAVDVLARSLEQHQEIGPSFRRLTAELLSTYAVLHEVAPNKDVLRQAMDLSARAVAVPADEEVCALPLARILVAWYRTTGDASALRRAEHLAVFTQSPREPRDVQAERASVLSQVHLERFWTDGSRDAFNDALMYARSACSVIPPGDRIRRSRLGLTLSEALRLYFVLTAERNALDEAIDRAGQAVKSLPKKSPWRKEALNSLTRCLIDSFQQSDHLPELENALNACRTVLSNSRGEDEALTYQHTALVLESECQLLLYRATGEDGALRQAVTGFKKAWSRALLSPSQLANPVTGYASALLELHGSSLGRAGSSVALDGLDSVIRQSQERTRLAPVSTLAPVLLARATLILGMPDTSDSLLRNAAADAQSAAEHATQPLQRLQALLLCGSLAVRLDSNDEVIRSHESATRELAPVLLLPTKEHENLVGSWDQLSREAAASAIETGQPDQALGLLEQRSTVLTAWSKESAAGLNLLKEAAPDLAAELRWLWALLHLDTEAARPIPPKNHLRARMSHLIDAIRAVPGFHDFFALGPAHRMNPTASEGPVVVLSAAARRCDALLVTRQGVSVVRLRVGLAELVHHAHRYQMASPERPSEALRVLAWLWESTVWPVLLALGLSDRTTYRLTRERDTESYPGVDNATRDDALPRIWWCPTGPFTMLPLHAAGHPDRTTAMDYAVHSYTPSLHALMTARHRERRPGVDSTQRMLIVLTGDDLQSGAREVDRISRLVPFAQILRGSETNLERVIAQLAEHQFVHFAGHLALQDGIPLLHLESKRPGGRHLSPDLIPDGALAYLTSCETAGDTSGGWTVAASFQSAGYRHVIATLGQLKDEAAMRVATSFYTLLQDSSGQLRPEHAAHALHGALQEARTANPRALLTYAAVVHLGP